MTRREIKAKAKEALGGNIFASNWLLAIVATIVVSALIGATAFTGVGPLLLGGPLMAGLALVFMKAHREHSQIDIGTLFSGFNKFGDNFVLYLLYNIFVGLWSLLFVIPGIVKAYSYSMIFYIKNDHPEYTWSQCFDESREIMRGHKFELFVLQLSFIGWAIVGSFCLGVGTLWVMAYMQASEAVFYDSIKKVDAPAAPAEAEVAE